MAHENIEGAIDDLRVEFATSVKALIEVIAGLTKELAAIRADIAKAEGRE